MPEKTKSKKRKIEPLSKGKIAIIDYLVNEYQPETAEDIQEALKDLLGGTIKSMIEAKWISTLDMSSTKGQIKKL